MHEDSEEQMRIGTGFQLSQNPAVSGNWNSVVFLPYLYLGNSHIFSHRGIAFCEHNHILFPHQSTKMENYHLPAIFLL